MAGTIKTQVQLGDSATATQNFTLTSAAADGTMKLARGNAGATTQDILTVDAAGKVSFPQGLTVTQANQTPLPGVATLISYAHGLGAVPASVELEIVCLTAEAGYSIGDVVTPFLNTAGGQAPFCINKTATAVEARTGSAAAFAVVHKTTGTNSGLTAANWAWRFKVRAA